MRTRNHPALRLDHPAGSRPTTPIRPPPAAGRGKTRARHRAGPSAVKFAAVSSGKSGKFFPVNFGNFCLENAGFRLAFPVGHIKTNWWLKITLPGLIKKKRPRLWDRGLPCYGRRSDGNRRHSL